MWSSKYVTPSTCESLRTSGLRVRSFSHVGGLGKCTLKDPDDLELEGVGVFGDFGDLESDRLIWRIFDDEPVPILT